MKPDDVLAPEEQRMLLSLARNAVAGMLQEGRKLPVVHALPEKLRRKRGVFTTLQLHGALRGCIGYPYPLRPIAEAVQEAAVAAAFHDPRFPPLTREEWPQVRLEISVLTEPKPTSPEKIQRGVHGLLIQCGSKSGLLLPQVAVEYGWDEKEFLAQTCRKAGLPLDAWKKKETKIFAFEAQVFSEEDHPPREKTSFH